MSTNEQLAALQAELDALRRDRQFIVSQVGDLYVQGRALAGENARLFAKVRELMEKAAEAEILAKK